MSKLNDLITKLCPDGVEYKTLKDVLTIKNGRDYKSFNQGSVPVYGSGGIMTYVDTYAYDGPSVLIPRKGSLSNVFYVEGQFWTVDTIFYTIINESQVLPKYVFYYLKNAHLEKLNQAGGVPSLSQGVLYPYPIPVPPLPVQSEIVRILDTFTELEAELEAELADRIEQYEYFRARLFDDKNLERMDGGKIEHDTVNSLVDVITPTAKIKKNEYKEVGLFPVIDQGMNTVIAGYTDNANALPDNEWVLFGDHTCSLKYFDGRFVQGADGLKILKAHDNVLPKFVFYALKNLNVSSNEYARHWTSFKKNELPVPSLATQERIVDILDRFDTLTTSLTKGIPAEIAMRREQYEYWRSRILDFPRLPDDAVSDGE